MTIDNLREKNFERKFINIFFLISILLCIFHLYLLTNQFPIKYTYTEWLINYEGGFIKRGLTGQIAIQISKFFALELKYSILVIQITSYLIYFLFLIIFNNFSIISNPPFVISGSIFFIICDFNFNF